MAIPKKLYFTKANNGNILLQKAEDYAVVASFVPAMSLVSDTADTNRFRVASSTSDDGFLIDYRAIDGALCVPIINANNRTDFLIQLSEKFFFLSKNPNGTTDATFGQLVLKAKGIQNGIPNTGTALKIGEVVADGKLETGDIVMGWKNANTYWESAQYLGGLVADKNNNYNPIFEAYF